MSHYKAKDERNVINVRWTGSTYQARLDGERTTCTAAPIIAARRLASSILCVPPDQVNLRVVDENLNGVSKYEIINH